MSAPITPERNSRVEWLLEQLIEKVQQEAGTMFHYAGRVDTVEDLEEITGHPNDMYFVGPEDASNWDEYIWATDEETGEGHWDRLGSVSIIIDDHLDAQSTNPVQNAVITLALADKTDLTVIGPAFSDQTQYSLGNLVVKDGVLYKYTSDTASTGTWDSTKWAATTIAALLADKLDSSTAASTYLTIASASATYLTLTDAATTYATKSEIPDISGKADSSMISAPYNSQTTYADGDLFTFEGELYKVDSTADYLKGPNLITAAQMTADGGFISGSAPKYEYGAYSPEKFRDRTSYRTIGYIAVTPGDTIAVTTSGNYSTGYADLCDSFYNSSKTRIGAYVYGGLSDHKDRSYTIPANVSYIRIGLDGATYQPSPAVRKVYTNMPKCVKTDVDTELGTKQNTLTFDSTPTANSTNPVTSGGVKDALDLKADTVSSVKAFKTAGVYDSAAGTYAVDDTTVESGVLYICIEAVSTPEAFDGSKWAAVTNTSGLTYLQPITNAAYTALLTKDANTLYAIM